ncbi:MAG: methyltransferase domain-containing protein [Candidatus Methanoperedens sp.]|nr:methyltransferase domain-containing protein [Candidatus Methanoperedens sp.]
MNQRWHYDEMKQVGTDYADAKEVEAYDARMRKIRDIRSETEKILDSLHITKDRTLLEIGCGTGEFTIAAAGRCKNIIAADVSLPMLEFARQKAKKKNVKNIEFHNAGFLTYEHSGEPVDAVVSQLALHHLPDFWKLIALRRICALLKQGGRFYLKDTVYTFDINNYEDFFNRFIEFFRETAGNEMAVDAETAVREEYSTLGWIMEGLLERAGFNIDKKEYFEGFMAVYECTKC